MRGLALTPSLFFQGAGFFAECVAARAPRLPSVRPPRVALHSPLPPSTRPLSSYDLFVIDGVTSMLKGLGPAQSYKYSYVNNQGVPSSLTSYVSIARGVASSLSQCAEG